MFAALSVIGIGIAVMTIEAIIAVAIVRWPR